MWTMFLQSVAIYIAAFLCELTQCELSIFTSQFDVLITNFTILPTDRIAYTGEVVNDQGNIFQCALLCVSIPTCFMACQGQDACTLGHLIDNSTDVIPTGTADLQTNNTYECFLKKEFFDMSYNDIVHLTGNTSAALNKSAIQSSVYGVFVAKNALDGDKHGVFWTPPKTCFHSVDSTADPAPYMVIDMANTYLVLAFNITNRSDGSINRLHDIEVHVGFQTYNKATNNYFQKNSLCYAYPDVVNALLFSHNCDPSPVAGRYISVQIVRYCPVSTNPLCIPTEGNKNVLCMCELDIWAFLIGE